MARHLVGPTPDTLVWDAAGNSVAGATATVWSARTGGTQYTDLLDINGAALTGGIITSADGTGTLDFGYFAFQGPDGITDFWIDFGNGKRKLLRANDAGGAAGTVSTVNGVAPDGSGDVTLTATNITNAVASTRTLTAGTGLTGGGTLAADRTFTVDFAASGTSSATKAVRADDSRLAPSFDSLSDVILTSPAEGQTVYFDASLNLVNGAAQPPGQDASNITSGTFAIARLAPGSVIVVDYYLTVYGAANAYPSTRPTTRTDICIWWIGPTSPGAIMLAGDIFTKTA